MIKSMGGLNLFCFFIDYACTRKHCMHYGIAFFRFPDDKVLLLTATTVFLINPISCTKCLEKSK